MYSYARQALVTIALLGTVLTHPTPGASQVITTGGTAILNPGDALRITVWRNAEVSGEFTIASDGTIAHPLYREVVVGGLTLAQSEERIGDLLRTLETSPAFVVQPLLQVSIGGEVREPSLYQIPPETSIAQAVALAGGATDRGRLDRVRLFRGGEEVAVDLTRPEAGMAQQPIRSGDQIFVQRRTSVFREYIAPAGSLIAAAVSLIGMMLR